MSAWPETDTRLPILVGAIHLPYGVDMDFTSLALTVVILGVGFYVLYLVVRAAVRDGITQAASEKKETLDSASD